MLNFKRETQWFCLFFVAVCYRKGFVTFCKTPFNRNLPGAIVKVWNCAQGKSLISCVASEFKACGFLSSVCRPTSFYRKNTYARHWRWSQTKIPVGRLPSSTVWSQQRGPAFWGEGCWSAIRPLQVRSLTARSVVCTLKVLKTLSRVCLRAGLLILPW